MEIVENAVERLNAAKLLAFPSRDKEAIFVATPSCVVTRFGIELNKPEDDASSIRLLDDGWYFIKFEGVPFPTHDDTIRKFDRLDDAVTAAINYHTGQPVTINEWLFPLHKHPEWSADQVVAVIPNAVQVDLFEWSKIEKYYDGLAGARMDELNIDVPMAKRNGHEWEWAIYVVPVDHISRTDIKLWLRRDLAKAWIVRSN